MQSALSTSFQQFFEKIASVYHVDIERVKKSSSKKLAPLPGLSKANARLMSAAIDLIGDDLSTMTSVRLKELCREKGVKVSGTKSELIQRLENPSEPISKNGTRAVTTRKKKNLFKPRDVSAIISKLKGPVSSLAIRKNNEGIYVHIETGLVFDPQTHKVVGCWRDGQTRWLTKEDIEKCIELGVFYELPENLDYGNVKVVDKTVEEVLGEDDFKEDPEEEDEEEVEDDDDYP